MTATTPAATPLTAPRTLREQLAETERLFSETGCYRGLDGDLAHKTADPITFEKVFSRLRGGLVSARETALNISASPIVKELGELCFAVYTPEGDSVALSTGIIVHVHTMSDVIKHMIRAGYEDNPGIGPGDIFCNNDSSIGDVHNADVQTIVPIFHSGRLVGWVAGVTHVIEVGASTPGSLPLGPISRFEDGIDISCLKIGANDELFADHVAAAAKATRMPPYWTLDERTRLAGCLIARGQVEQLIDDIGVDHYLEYCAEMIEDGRRAFRSRLFAMTVPGRYRAPAFAELTMADEPRMPSQARVDTLMHAPVELRVTAEARLELDLDGASSWGHHSANCTPSAMQGGLWVLLTQTILANDKINDGAYYGISTNFPPGSWSNHQNPQASTGSPWRFLVPSFTGVLKSLSQSLHARGFVEEVLAPYAMSANTFQGGGIDHYGRQASVTNFAISCVGGGGRPFADGLDHAAAMWNPQGDTGDCETWEISEPFLFLGASVKPNTAGAGRWRGGSGWETLRMAWGTPFFEVQNIGNSAVTMQSGLWGGYPGATGYRHNIRETNMLALASQQQPYPVRDGDAEASELLAVTGDRQFDRRTLTMPEPMRSGDLYLSPKRGGAGVGDPLERPVAAVAADVRGGYVTPRLARSLYGAILFELGEPDTEATERRRRAIRDERASSSVPVGEWIEQIRQRLIADDEWLIEPVRRMYTESMRLSPRWAERFRRFWRLGREFEFGEPTPTVDITDALLAGRDPAELQRQPRTDARLPLPDPPPPAVNAMSEGELEALVDGEMPASQVRAVQSGHKDGARFETWLAVCQRRWPFPDDRVLLPLGLHLAIVDLPDGRRVIRSDSGHVFGHWTENYKLGAVMRVRDSGSALEDVFPERMAPDHRWNELREFYDPLSFTLLDVESVPPAYPIIHDFLPDLETFYAEWLGRPLPPERTPPTGG